MAPARAEVPEATLRESCVRAGINMAASATRTALFKSTMVVHYVMVLLLADLHHNSDPCKNQSVLVYEDCHLWLAGLHYQNHFAQF